MRIAEREQDHRIFDLPWRIHWRLPRGGSVALAEAILAVSPLFLLLEADSAEDLAPLSLPRGNLSATVVFCGWRKGGGVGDFAGAARVEFPVEGAREAEEVLRRSGPAPESGPPPALRWIPRAGGLADLPRLLAAARAAGWGLTLSNRPADMEADQVGGPPRLDEMSSPEWERARAEAASSPPGRLIIHDFVITRALALAPPEARGCEAADALAYVDGEGGVFPCSSLLVPLGNLRRESFPSIWRKPERARLRRDLFRLPPVCGSCPWRGGCRGGCRGASYHRYRRFGETDPLCEERNP